MIEAMLKYLIKESKYFKTGRLILIDEKTDLYLFEVYDTTYWAILLICKELSLISHIHYVRWEPSSFTPRLEYASQYYLVVNFSPRSFEFSNKIQHRNDWWPSSREETL